MRRGGIGSRLCRLFLAAACLVPATAAAQEADWQLTTWSDEEREFFLDGPQYLLDPAELSRVRNLDPAARRDYIETFLSRARIAEGIEQRRRRIRQSGAPFFDVRSQLLFLHGEPDDIEPVDCDQTFRPLEIWRYGPEDGEHENLVIFQPKPNEAFQLWLPELSKRALYMPEMEYWLEQYHELRGLLRARRFDLQVCKEARSVDRVTGIGGLFGFREQRPSTARLRAWLRPPEDLDAWAVKAAADKVETPTELEIEDPIVTFPARHGQRILTRILLSLPSGAAFEPFVDDTGREEVRINVEGVVEQPGRIFDAFRVRFLSGTPPENRSLALPMEHPLRPGSVVLVRFLVRDEIGGAAAWGAVPIEVPLTPQTEPASAEDRRRLVAAAEQLAADLPETALDAASGLVLVPPESEVVLGLWRADVLVTGHEIVAMRFYVDDVLQVTRRRPPFSAEVRLARYPAEQVVRVEGLDADGNVAAADEIVLNQQRGELRVLINEPRRDVRVTGKVDAAVSVIVPEERVVQEVEFRVGEEVQAVLRRPPWRAEIDVPASGDQELVYLAVAATLDDGRRAEDVRFLNAPDFTESVQIDLVELYTTVVDNANRPVTTLAESDFTVLEEGRPQKLAKFELVEDLPLTLGIVIDTSGSMETSLGEARRTASHFLANLITPKDRSFAVAFASRPELLIGRTSDVEAVAASIENLRAIGNTALHDALITSLYYFRGVRGRRALVLLSDGEDTSSTVGFPDVEEYARRSAVAIYTIGLGIGRSRIGLRNKLNDLAKVTGGRSFFISRAEDLAPVYDEIERELRSQYLLAYNSSRTGGDDDEYREVEVKVAGRFKARTISGYYP